MTNLFQILTSLSILILILLAIYLAYKNNKLSKQNSLNDVTNSLLRLNLNKKEIDEKIKNTDISDLVNARNNDSDNAKSSTGDGA